MIKSHSVAREFIWSTLTIAAREGNIILDQSARGLVDEAAQIIDANECLHAFSGFDLAPYIAEWLFFNQKSVT